MNLNNNILRRILVIFLFGFGGLSVIAVLTTSDLSQSNNVTFAPLFQVLGKTPQSLSRSVTKMLPIDSIDEGELGKSIKSHYASVSSTDLESEKSLGYLNFIMKRLERFKKKPFSYEVQILNSDSLNAMALPGGLILVTSGLLKAVKSESELVSVLGHEMGHIELSHCFDTVKYEILSRKIANNSLGGIADFARNLLIRHSFSKTQEDEADNYGFQLLTNSEYDPSAMSKAFARLKSAESVQNSSTLNPIGDYLMSHPPLDQRITKFATDAEVWWKNRSNEKRYIGVKNLEDKTDLSSKDFGDGERTSVYTTF